jgi:hypothetical protein
MAVICRYLFYGGIASSERRHDMRVQGFRSARARAGFALASGLLVSFMIHPLVAGASARTTTPTCQGQVATIVGTPGDDVINGTPGNDVIVGLGGNDVINGMGGNDLICAGAGNDVVNGNGGDDTENGQSGNDTVNGQNGDDSLSGGSGSDDLNGGSGTDDENGGTGDDSCDQTTSGGDTSGGDTSGGDDLRPTTSFRGSSSDDQCETTDD